MSWSVSGQTDAANASEFLALKREEAMQQNPDGGDQFDAAKDACLALISGGTVGGADKKFSVVMAGHGNPNHEPRSGWANDCITVSVSQV